MITSVRVKRDFFKFSWKSVLDISSPFRIKFEIHVQASTKPVAMKKKAMVMTTHADEFILTKPVMTISGK